LERILRYRLNLSGTNVKIVPKSACSNVLEFNCGAFNSVNKIEANNFWKNKEKKVKLQFFTHFYLSDKNLVQSHFLNLIPCQYHFSPQHKVCKVFWTGIWFYLNRFGLLFLMRTTFFLDCLMIQFESFDIFVTFIYKQSHSQFFLFISLIKIYWLKAN